MPAQTQDIGTAYYAQGDTAPNLRRQLLDGNRDPINLTGSTVVIDIGYASYDYYYSPMRKIVDGGACIVEGGTQGWVQWEPQVGDLDIPGAHYYRFKITYPGGGVQHIPPNTYEMLVVSVPVGGVDG